MNFFIFLFFLSFLQAKVVFTGEVSLADADELKGSLFSDILTLGIANYNQGRGKTQAKTKEFKIYFFLNFLSLEKLIQNFDQNFKKV